MDIRHTCTLIGPFATQDRAQVAADAAMGKIQMRRGSTIEGASQWLHVFVLGGQHWLELGRPGALPLMGAAEHGESHVGAVTAGEQHSPRLLVAQLLG